MPEIRDVGAELVAITPDLTDHPVRLIEARGLRFEILTDRGNEVGARFGLRFEFPEDLREVYRGLGVDLPTNNGEPSWTLSMPARYIIGPDGKVHYSRVHPDYTKRPAPSETLRALEQLTGHGGIARPPVSRSTSSRRLF